MLVMLVSRVLVYNSQNLSSRLCFIDKHIKHRSVVPQTPVSDSQRYFGMKERRVCNSPVLLRSRPLKIIHGFLRVGIPDNDLPVGAWSNASVLGKVNGDVTNNAVQQKFTVICWILALAWSLSGQVPTSRCKELVALAPAPRVHSFNSTGCYDKTISGQVTACWCSYQQAFFVKADSISAFFTPRTWSRKLFSLTTVLRCAQYSSKEIP